MGLCMISEGVIPIAMNDIIRTVICTATGCGVTGAISFSLDVGSKVPSGGVFVIPAMSNPLAALYRTVSRNSSYRCFTCTDQEKENRRRRTNG